eukprot:GHVT01065280.1.p3 GENE.GHVT01065280.1~~GHVT01065280.1.p3  ORF type:complete len:101 (+),score=24.62 GHVT01065280.1:1307-1609(+)
MRALFFCVFHGLFSPPFFLSFTAAPAAPAATLFLQRMRLVPGCASVVCRLRSRRTWRGAAGALRPPSATEGLRHGHLELDLQGSTDIAVAAAPATKGEKA